MKAGLLAFACLTLTACASEAGKDEMSENVTQWPGLPADKAAQIAAIGPVIDPAPSIAVVQGMVDAPPYNDVNVASDLAYGDDPAQRLDVYTQTSADQAAASPVLLFVHGGGFVGRRVARGRLCSAHRPPWPRIRQREGRTAALALLHRDRGRGSRLLWQRQRRPQ